MPDAQGLTPRPGAGPPWFSGPSERRWGRQPVTGSQDTTLSTNPSQGRGQGLELGSAPGGPSGCRHWHVPETLGSSIASRAETLPECSGLEARPFRKAVQATLAFSACSRRQLDAAFPGTGVQRAPQLVARVFDG